MSGSRENVIWDLLFFSFSGEFIHYLSVLMKHRFVVIVQLSPNHGYSYDLVDNVGGWSPDLEQAPYGIALQIGSWTSTQFT